MLSQQRKEYLSRIIEGSESLAIPICDNIGVEIGIMRPITKTHLQCHDVIEKMTNWRNHYKTFFMTQFNATQERTEKWLKNVVLANPEQLLFLIYCKDNLIGQFGFKELNGNSVFLDNLMRGESGGHPLLMRYAVSAMVTWLFDVMKVNEVYGFIFANNAMSLKLHKDLGFSFTEKYPLNKQVDGEEITWVVGKTGELSTDDKYYQKIVMTRNI